MLFYPSGWRSVEYGALSHRHFVYSMASSWAVPALTPHQVHLESVGSYLVYADVRIYNDVIIRYEHSNSNSSAGTGGNSWVLPRIAPPFARMASKGIAGIRLDTVAAASFRMLPRSADNGDSSSSSSTSCYVVDFGGIIQGGQSRSCEYHTSNLAGELWKGPDGMCPRTPANTLSSLVASKLTCAVYG